jgi:hypothetical protein
VNQKNEAGESVRRGRGCSVQAMGLGLRVVGRQYDQPRRSPSGLGFPNYCQRIALANRCPNGNIVGAEPKLRDRHIMNLRIYYNTLSRPKSNVLYGTKGTNGQSNPDFS